jgi:putative acetyltransferase
MFDIREDDLTGAGTRGLLALHLAGMHANTPAGHVFALDLSGLQAPGITLWSAWDGEQVAGIGALKRLGGGRAEIKSMRTHPDHLRRGVAQALLRHIIAVARAEQLATLSLETGRGPAFEPALALYRAHGFVGGPAFGDYAPSDFSQFFHLDCRDDSEVIASPHGTGADPQSG